MWMGKNITTGEEKKGNGLVGVAIDRDKGSQYAIKWAIDNILRKGQTVILIHVKLKSSASFSASPTLPPQSMSISLFPLHLSKSIYDSYV